MRRIYHSLCYLLIVFMLSGCFFANQAEQRWDLAPEGSTAFGLSRDGRFALIYSKQQQLVLWDLQQDKKLSDFGAQDPQANPVSKIRLADSGRYAITASQNNFAVWDLAWTQAKGLWSITDGLIRDVDLSSDGEQVLLGLTNGKAIYVDLVSGRRMEFLAHREKVNSVALSANGRYALTGGNDYHAYLWDTKTGQILRQFDHEQRVNRVALQREGKLAFTSDDGNQALIWDLTSQNKPIQLRSFRRQLVFSTARFSDDGKKLITGTPSGLVEIWNAQEGKKITSVESATKKDSGPAQAVVYDATFDAQQRAVSGSSAGIAQAWRVEN
ncbi:lipoprotein [Vibrio metoecus]|uniref:Lipoprotein n=2 Tax=Vibrio metoecus TaxID=1481663 RepID=A0A0Q0N9P8_VIBMT|nr:lipoprotein [Vibrio metoecus]